MSLPGTFQDPILQETSRKRSLLVVSTWSVLVSKRLCNLIVITRCSSGILVQHLTSTRASSITAKTSAHLSRLASTSNLIINNINNNNIINLNNNHFNINNINIINNNNFNHTSCSSSSSRDSCTWRCSMLRGSTSNLWETLVACGSKAVGQTEMLLMQLLKRAT